jgi:hypothetical protein
MDSAATPSASPHPASLAWPWLAAPPASAIEAYAVMVHEFRSLQSWKFDLQGAIRQLQAEIVDTRMLIAPLVDTHIPVELTQPTLDFGNQTVRLESREEPDFNNAGILWNDPATWPMMEDSPRFNAAFVEWLRQQIVAWMDCEGREMMRSC